jgi:hypothetical protein
VTAPPRPTCPPPLAHDVRPPARRFAAWLCPSTDYGTMEGWEYIDCLDKGKGGFDEFHYIYKRSDRTYGNVRGVPLSWTKPPDWVPGSDHERLDTQAFLNATDPCTTQHHVGDRLLVLLARGTQFVTVAGRQNSTSAELKPFQLKLEQFVCPGKETLLHAEKAEAFVEFFKKDMDRRRFELRETQFDAFVTIGARGACSAACDAACGAACGVWIDGARVRRAHASARVRVCVCVPPCACLQ